MGNTRDNPEDSPEDKGMSNGEIERLPVSQLENRYGIVRSAVYTRLNALNIKPDKIGGKAYVNGEQLRLLDELHQFLQSGRNTPEFLEMRGMQKVEERSDEFFSDLSTGSSTGLSTIPPDLIRLVSAIAAEMASRVQPPVPEPDRFAYFETLERATQNGWLLSTTEVAYLLKLPAADLQLYGDTFTEAGFIFTRSGYRSQGEVAWRVSKPIK